MLLECGAAPALPVPGCAGYAGYAGKRELRWQSYVGPRPAAGLQQALGLAELRFFIYIFPPLSTLRIKTLLSLLSLGMHKTSLKQFLCSFSFVLLVGALRKV